MVNRFRRGAGFIASVMHPASLAISDLLSFTPRFFAAAVKIDSTADVAEVRLSTSLKTGGGIGVGPGALGGEGEGGSGNRFN